MTQKNPYLEKELTYFQYTFKRQPLLLTKAKGSFVWDENGKRYLDFFSGLAVCGVGHNNDRVVQAIKDQSNRLLHSSNYFYTKPQVKLAEALTSRWQDSRVFFCNSGAEANEWAIKLARLWATKNGKKGREILTFDKSFHGRTLATIAASDGAKRTAGLFDPLPAGFRVIPFNDLSKTKEAVTEHTIAVFVEPVQGEGGINIASRPFLNGLGQLCRECGLLLILDEVQSGMGRTGTFFAFEQYEVKPDIVTLAKGLAGGLPLGATLASPGVAKWVEPGMHGSTFGGNPVACAASLEVLKLLSPAALKKITRLGNDLRQKLDAFRKYPSVKEIRTCGLMVGIELITPGDPYVVSARQKGLLINCTQGNVLRFLPPYFMTQKEMTQCLSILESVFDELKKSR